MSVVKINALAVPPQAGDEIVKRFSARLDELSAVSGFEGFELLRPTGEAELRWFVYSRWADEESYQAWRTGDVFARGHAGQAASKSPDGESEQRPAPVSMGSTLLEFEVSLSVAAQEP